MKRITGFHPGRKNAFEAQTNMNALFNRLKVPMAILTVFIMVGCSIFIATSSSPSTRHASIYVDRSWTMINDDDPGGDCGYWSSIAIDSQHHVHMVYEAGSTAVRYATNESGSFVYTMVDGWYSGASGICNSMAISSNNKVYIATHNETPTESLYVLARSIYGSTWTSTLIDNTGDPGCPGAGNNNMDISIATDSNNRVHIAYWRHTTNDLVYATNATGVWVITPIDTVGTVGNGCSLGIDSSNKAHISYWNSTSTHLSYATNAGGSWIHANIDNTSNVGSETALVVDSSDKIHIVYQNSSAVLSYMTNSGGRWSVPVSITANVGTYNYGRRPTMAIDNSNYLHVAHEALSVAPWDTNLIYTTNENGTWDTHLIESFNQVGVDPSIAVDTDGKVLIAAHDNEAVASDLKLYSSVIVIPEFGSVAMVSVFAAVIVLVVMRSRKKTESEQ